MAMGGVRDGCPLKWPQFVMNVNQAQCEKECNVGILLPQYSHFEKNDLVVLSDTFMLVKGISYVIMKFAQNQQKLYPK